MNLKVKDNLFILGSRVISYETEVARIEGDDIVANGCYSRTTGKQLHFLSRVTGLRLITSSKSKRNSFHQLEYGAKCESPRKEMISAAGAKLILSQMETMRNFADAAAAVFFKLKKRDREFVAAELRRKGWKEEQLVALNELLVSLKQFEII